MANAKAVGPHELPVERLKLRLNHDLISLVPPGDEASVAPTGSTAAVARSRDKGFAQK